MEIKTHVHAPTIYVAAPFNDDSKYSVCECGESITKWGVYDPDRGIVYGKEWKVEK